MKSVTRSVYTEGDVCWIDHDLEIMFSLDNLFSHFSEASGVFCEEMCLALFVM